MKYFIVENNQPVGPYEINELVAKGLKGDDLVWCEGMDQWTTASNVSEIMVVLTQSETVPPVMPLNMNQPPVYVAGQMVEEPVGQSVPACPNTWLVASIIVTLFCCAPFGIAGIVYAAKVETLWQSNRYEEAEKASRNAKKWMLTAFICGFVFYSLYTVLMATVVSKNLF